MQWQTSGELVLMTLVGGMATVLGQAVSTALIVTLQNKLADRIDSWVSGDDLRPVRERHLPQRGSRTYARKILRPEPTCCRRFFVRRAGKRQGLTPRYTPIAIDEIKNAARARTYFGADLSRNGIVPVVVVVSNYSEHRVNVKPSDVLLHKGNEVIDPLPLEFVVAAAKRGHGFLRAKTESQIDAFFSEVAFRETILLPNETYQGVMFFPSPKPERTEDSFFKAYSLFREAGPRIRLAVTDLDTRDRLHFGPFSAFLGEDTGWLRDISYR